MPEDLRERVARLRAERNAVILVHNYEPGPIQDLADHLGDSLGLARQAAQTRAACIVFCGVHFMAETAAILNPDKPVYMPDPHAGCPMANMCTGRELAAFKAQHPGATVVTYVNSTAEVKAQSDICCTSANAVDVVRDIAGKVLFVPDRNLADYAARTLDREDIVPWNGFCPTHERILPEHVAAARAEHPEAELVAHPECRPAIVDLADHVASTSGIVRYCAESRAREFLVATEVGLLHRLRKENPDKAFYPASQVADCPDMKLTTLEKLAWCLEERSGRVQVPEEIAARARVPIERMLEKAARSPVAARGEGG